MTVKTISQSQRLRAVLYRLWEQDKKDKEFEVYYKEVMDYLIDVFIKR